MPRRSKGARLQLKAARRDKAGRITHRATWIIRDNGRDIGAGCAADEIAAAEQALKDYIASKYIPKRKTQDIESIPIGDVLSIYLDAELAAPRSIQGHGQHCAGAPRLMAPDIEWITMWHYKVGGRGPERVADGLF